MTEIETKKLARASNTACNKQVQHILLTLSADGKKVNVAGAENLVTPLLADVELFQQLNNTLVANATRNVVAPANTLQVDFPLLPCSPFSEEWGGSAKIRSILRKMLNSLGFGKAGRAKQYGVGNPPLGWPETISWENFSGTTSSKLKSIQLTSIIVSMLEAAGIDPATHVEPLAVEVMMVNPETGEVEMMVEDGMEQHLVGDVDPGMVDLDDYMNIPNNRNIGQ